MNRSWVTAEIKGELIDPESKHFGLGGRRVIMKWFGPTHGIAEINHHFIGTSLPWPTEKLGSDILYQVDYIQRLDQPWYWWNRMKVAWFNLGQRHYHARCRLIAKLCYMGIGYREQGSIVEWRNLWAKKPETSISDYVEPVEVRPMTMGDILKIARNMGYKG